MALGQSPEAAVPDARNVQVAIAALLHADLGR
jgi:hypothetical protein